MNIVYGIVICWRPTLESGVLVCFSLTRSRRQRSLKWLRLPNCQTNRVSWFGFHPTNSAFHPSGSLGLYYHIFVRGGVKRRLVCRWPPCKQLYMPNIHSTCLRKIRRIRMHGVFQNEFLNSVPSFYPYKLFGAAMCSISEIHIAFTKKTASIYVLFIQLKCGYLFKNNSTNHEHNIAYRL